MVLLGLFIMTAQLTVSFWAPALASRLYCSDDGRAVDAILVDTLEPDYLVFERSRQLRQRGRTTRILVMVQADADGSTNDVAAGIVDVMARVSRIGAHELLPVKIDEPITLNAARQVKAHLEGRGVASLLIVTSGLRSRRTWLTYTSQLAPQVVTSCHPVSGERDATTWHESWHGIQSVSEQLAKLLYYQLYVLPVLGRR